MTTVSTDYLADAIQDLKQAAQEALEAQTVEEFEAIERRLAETDVLFREAQQAMWVSEAQATLKRLERNEPLGEIDHSVLRAFLISDATSYLSLENDYNDWLNEFERLIGDLEKRVRMVTRESIADVRGVLKDAIRLTPDIRNYLDERTRVARCEAALKDLDRSSREVLAKLLTEQLRSAKR